MRRVILLALLAPTAALAQININTGTFSRGFWSGSFTTTLDVTLTGDMGSVTLDTGTLSQAPNCVGGSTCYMFIRGTVSAMEGSTVFTDTLTTGSIIKTGNSVSETAGLEPNSVVSGGQATASFLYTGQTLTAGIGTVSGASAAPEPGTLALLALGLLGIGISRRRLAR